MLNNSPGIDHLILPDDIEQRVIEAANISVETHIENGAKIIAGFNLADIFDRVEPEVSGYDVFFRGLEWGFGFAESVLPDSLDASPETVEKVFRSLENLRQREGTVLAKMSVTAQLAGIARLGLHQLGNLEAYSKRLGSELQESEWAQETLRIGFGAAIAICCWSFRSYERFFSYQAARSVRPNSHSSHFDEYIEVGSYPFNPN